MNRPPIVRTLCPTCKAVSARDTFIPCVKCDMDTERDPLPSPGTSCEIFSFSQEAYKPKIYLSIYTRPDGKRRFYLLKNAVNFPEAHRIAEATGFKPTY